MPTRPLTSTLRRTSSDKPMTGKQNERPDMDIRLDDMDAMLKDAQAALNGIQNEEQSDVKASLADLMEELNRLNSNLRAMAEELAPKNGDL